MLVEGWPCGVVLISAWPAADVPTGAVAVDTANPWNSEPAPSGTGRSAAQDLEGWANFGTAGFADFDANFAAPSASTQSAQAVEMVTADSSVSNTTGKSMLWTFVPFVVSLITFQRCCFHYI